MRKLPNQPLRAVWRWMRCLVLCRLRDRHDWGQREFKRYCSRCDAEEWLMGNRYPKIGEPQYYWKRIR